jgi:hypothetical protein
VRRMRILLLGFEKSIRFVPIEISIVLPFSKGNGCPTPNDPPGITQYRCLLPVLYSLKNVTLSDTDTEIIRQIIFIIYRNSTPEFLTVPALAVGSSSWSIAITIPDTEYHGLINPFWYP